MASSFKLFPDPSQLIDSHAHLSDKAFDADRAEVIGRASAAGVTKIVDAGTDIGSSRKILAYYPEFKEQLLPAAGIHPEILIPGSDLYKPEVGEQEIPQMLKEVDQLLAEHPEIFMVGECGLDYYWLEKNVTDQDKLEEIKILQTMLLRGHLQLAEKYNKPVTVHCRNAFDDMLSLFREFFGKISGVMHSFTYGPEEAEKVWDAGWMIGINGIVTYPSANNLRDFILDRIKVAQVSDPSGLYQAGIVLETDAPYLGLEPNRSARNEPEAVKRLFEYLTHR